MNFRRTRAASGTDPRGKDAPPAGSRRWLARCVLLAAIVSMLLLIHRTANPHVARLGRVPGTRRYSDCARHADNETVPGILILRVEAALLYFNATHVRDEVRSLIAAEGDTLRLVVWDLSTSPYVDIAAARMLGEIQRELAVRGAELRA